MFGVLSILLLILQLSDGVVIKPDSNDNYVSVTLPSPANSIDAVNNEWDMIRPINAWGLEMKLDAEQYSFRPGVTSTISVEVDMTCTGECDAFYAFSIGDIKYVTYMHDYDGALWGNPGAAGGTGGIFTYPACKSTDNNPLQTGNPSQLLNGANDNWNMLREVMTGGQAMDRFNAARVNRNTPIKFEFINDDVADTFTVKFTSSAAAYQNGVECVYHGAAPKCLDFIWYQTPDAGDKATAASPQRVKSFSIESENTGWTSDCTDPLVDSGASCVAEEELSSVEFTLDSSFTDYQSNKEHEALVYFNNEIYGCRFTPNSDQFSCALDCTGASNQCSPLSLHGVDCNDDPSIKVAITNENEDYAVFSSVRINTASGTYFGANAFCGTGEPHEYEIDGDMYINFLIPGNDVCGLGLLSNYKAVCISNSAQCLPSTLVIELDTNKPNEDIDYALIEDDGDLTEIAHPDCDDGERCCSSNDCEDGSYCNPMGKCEEKPVCPAGSDQVGLHNADITDCGLESCSDANRYNKNSIEECRDHCKNTEGCKTYTFAPLNGDKNHEDVTVCTIYSDTTQNNEHGPNQIMCVLNCDGIICDDLKPCTSDACSYGECIFSNVDGENDECEEVEGNACTQNICDGGECTNPATKTASDCLANSDLCDGEQFCNTSTGECDTKQGTEVICGQSSNLCLKEGVCDPLTGQCSYDEPTDIALNCGDANMCNGVEMCNVGTGECDKGTPVECPFGEKCVRKNGECVPECGQFDIDGFLNKCSSLWSGLQRDLRSMRKDIAKNDRNIGKNTNKIKKNAVNILSNKRGINAANRAIKQNDRDIQRNKNGIDRNRKKIKQNMDIIRKKLQRINRRISNLRVSDGRPCSKTPQKGRHKRADVFLADLDLNNKDIFIISLILINIMVIFYCWCQQRKKIKYAAIDTVYSSDDEVKQLNKL